MSFRDTSIDEFSSILASKAPVPGGGGAAALMGVVGVALGSMVASLTAGKEEYVEHNDEVLFIIDRAEDIRSEMLQLIDDDATAFQPLSLAYKLPKNDPGREEIMEAALRLACSVPLHTMRAATRAIELCTRMAHIGNSLAISDAGAGVISCKAALQSASLSVFINTKGMIDRDRAASLDREADVMLETYCPLADETYDFVKQRLKG
jgi:formiminotetrahydrofolate cyclodeaminase